MSVVIPSLRGAIAVPGWAKNELWRRARAVPSLDLRFADNKSLVDAVTGASLVTFTRASNGTYTDSAGVLQTAATDVPRFDHNPTTGESLGLLVEGQRTNTLLRSNEFNTTWAPSTGDPTVTIVAQTAPDGNAQSWKLTEGTTNGSQSLLQANVSYSAGANAYSVYVKAGERFKLSLRESAITGATVLFDVSSGTVLSTTGLGTPTGEITSAGNGWYRCTMYLTQASTADRSARIFVVDDATTTAEASFANRTGDGTSGIYIWGAQVEAGATVSSYIPTTTATVTRSADVASIGSSAFASFYNQSEGTLFADARTQQSAAGHVLAGVSTGSFASSAYLVKGAGNVLTAAPDASPSNLGIPLSSVSSNVGLQTALAFTAGTGSASAVMNGGTVGTDASTGIPITMSQMGIGCSPWAIGTTLWNGPIKRLCYWPSRLQDSTLQAITG